MTAHCAWVATLLTVLAAGSASGQTARSTAPAEQLIEQMRSRKMQHLAAADPHEKGRYVAASLLGGNQLLVVSARYAQPALFDERLFRGDHEGAYVELNAASIKDGKLFVQDLGEPGIHPTRSEDAPFDIVYESGGKGTAFHGDWKAQGLSRQEYQDAFTSLDDKYAHALDALLSALAAAAGVVQGERDPLHSEGKASLRQRGRAAAASGKINNDSPKAVASAFRSARPGPCSVV